MNPARPRRSALYLPASNPRAIEKATSLDCDVILFDLEDAVAPDAKALAREQACQAVKSRRFDTRELVIRVNGPGTPWHDEDLRMASEALPDAILLPKVDAPEQVRMSAATLENLGWSRQTGLWCMLETPKGVLASERIATAHDRVNCLVMGTSDLTVDLHALHTGERLPLLVSLGLCLLAARAHGKVILDGVSLDLSDAAAFREACRQARELGFDGKTLVHPSQISDCNAAFSPTPAELERARAIVDAHAGSRAEGRAVTLLDGRLVEELHVREAERLLALGTRVGFELAENGKNSR